MPFVPKKSIEQQDIQALQRARQRLVDHRTAKLSQIHGLLLDRGFAIGKSITRAQRATPEILGDGSNEPTDLARAAIHELYDLFRDLDRRIGSFDQKIDRVFRAAKPASGSRGSRGSALDYHGHGRRDRRRRRVQEWQASC